MYRDLILNPAFSAWKFDDFLAKFVGRKNDGTPLIFDGQPTASQDLNHFFYQTDTAALQMNDGTIFSVVKSDTSNSKCPMFAQVRKVNPREIATDQGGPTDTLTFRILRRGISFGPAYNYADQTDPVNSQERGYCFFLIRHPSRDSLNCS